MSPMSLPDCAGLQTFELFIFKFLFMIWIILIVNNLGYQIIDNKDIINYFVDVQCWGMGEVINCFRSCPGLHVMTAYLHRWLEDAFKRH